jgi:hypothetical protein
MNTDPSFNTPDIAQEKPVEPTVGEVHTSPLPEISRGAVPTGIHSDGQLAELIRIVRENPRNEARSIAKAEMLATMNKEVASSCFYKLKRYDKKNKRDVFIEGPSIRLAEIFCSAWKNTYRGSSVVDISATHVTARGECIDLENIVFKYATVKRSIVGSSGLRYGDDMITTTAQASCAIAERNAVLAVIPRSFLNLVLASAKKVAIGDVKSLAERRQKMIEEFGKMSISIEQILVYVDRHDVESIELDDMELLVGTFTALKEGITSIDDVFAKKGATTPKDVPEIIKLNVMYASVKSRLSADHLATLNAELKAKGVDVANPKLMIPDQISAGIAIIQGWAVKIL